MEEIEKLRRLNPFKQELLTWVYHHMVLYAEQQGILVVWIIIPQMTEGPWTKQTKPVQKLAQDVGFITLNLSDVYKNRDTAKLVLAERLYLAMQENDAQMFSHPSVQSNHPIIHNNTQQQLEEEN